MNNLSNFSHKHMTYLGVWNLSVTYIDSESLKYIGIFRNVLLMKWRLTPYLMLNYCQGYFVHVIHVKWELWLSGRVLEQYLVSIETATNYSGWETKFVFLFFEVFSVVTEIVLNITGPDHIFLSSSSFLYYASLLIGYTRFTIHLILLTG
jgi:hypothetical protein